MDGSESRAVFAFGEFRLDECRRTLVRGPDQAHVRLSPKVFDAALFFVRHAGSLLSKPRLLEHLWPRLCVEENSLTQVVSELRQALGERRGENRYLVTVPRRGYQFVADVIRIDATDPREDFSTCAVAVLPFVVLSRRRGDDFVGFGLATTVRHCLSAIPGLRVFARTTDEAIVRPGAADFIVEGTVQHAGPRLRITAQLVEVASGAQVWSLILDRGARNVLAVEDEIATRVARALRRRLPAMHAVPPGIQRVEGTRKWPLNVASVASSRF